jgi:hypothetical protein
MLSSDVSETWQVPDMTSEPPELHGDRAFQVARYVLFDRIVYGFMDDMEHSMAIIFDAFGWEWTQGELDKLSHNVNKRPKAAVLAPGEMSYLNEKLLALNHCDVALYKETRARYDSAKNTP